MSLILDKEMSLINTLTHIFTCLYICAYKYKIIIQNVPSPNVDITNVYLKNTKVKKSF